MDPTEAPRPIALAVTLLVTGAGGLLASFALTLDAIAILKAPDAPLTCSVSALIGCSTNLSSAQGSIFGFPNPLLGLVFWSAVTTVGTALLARARFAGWFWALFSTGALAALVLVVWFIGQSIFELRVLCPWCMATWAVAIPMFLAVTLHSLQLEPLPPVLRRVASLGYSWIPAITVASYLIVALLAQWQLDVLGRWSIQG